MNLESENGAAFAYVADRHREVTQALGEAFSHLAQLLDSAGQELEASADLYHELDEDQATRLDQQYPR